MILAINRGSSSVKFGVYEDTVDKPALSGNVERIGMPDGSFRMFCARFSYRKTTHTGLATSIVFPVGVSRPVFLSIRNSTILSESWFAARRKDPVGSILKLRGVFP